MRVLRILVAYQIEAIGERLEFNVKDAVTFKLQARPLKFQWILLSLLITRSFFFNQEIFFK